ncbi:L,D-transpeptidase [Mesobaculum littorinae]|uniref:L,D-transpeptidase n=1 Tax=Mesobaculum littorinae TaxID=2486419 RepID=A0A438AFF7_9RHOB|nr:L,D-transpeptidase [Mesobaculum littorinae]RVV97335.1 L,D-transpeptidase [Mesobaculum littorinae]
MNRRDMMASGLAAFGASLWTGSALAQAAATEAGAAAGAAPLAPDAAEAAVDPDLPARLRPALVTMRANLPAGQVHVFPDHFQLFWTLPNRQAWRYGIRVGRKGLYEPGRYYVGAKKEWPSWKPTPDMIEREPEHYGKYAEEGMEGGPNNPLGARALYLFQEGRGDTYLRIHGTADEWSIGRAVSNGCAGLTNEQIKLLYTKVPMNATVVLYPKMIPAGVS